MKTHIIYLLFTFCILSGIYAQNVSISGRVTDGKGGPVAFANIALQRTDSSFVTGCTSDDKGSFKILKAEEVCSCVSMIWRLPKCKCSR